MVLTALLAGPAVPLVDLMGGDGRVGELAVLGCDRPAQEIWPLFALMQPANGAVFALDGILIGAGDTRFLMWE